MKTVLSLLIFLFLHTIIIGQNPTEVSPELKKQIFQYIESEITTKKVSLEKDKVSGINLEFALDTFRAERFMEKYINLDYSDFGMRQAGYETAKLYDLLLNKYYQKLLTTLKAEDKKTLVQAQKAWISFRDNEFKLVGTLSKPEYSGGGTIQQLIESSEYLDLVKKRTIALFNHYLRTIEPE